MTLIYVCLILECVMSLAAYITYAVDKRRAIKDEWRIRERTLLLLSFFFGAPGAYLAMRRKRHKTRHWKFRILVPLCLILQAALMGYLIYRLF